MRAIALIAGLAALAAPSAVHAQCNVVDSDLVESEAEVTDLAATFDAGPISGRLRIGGTVTDVVTFTNHTGCRVRVIKKDPKLFQPGNEAVEIAPGATVQSSMWVPWLDDGTAEREESTVMRILIEEKPYFLLWQRRGFVRFLTHRPWILAAGSRANLMFTAPAVPGLGVEGGRRALHIALTPEGRPFFKIEGIPE
jgi:hypothetical protein